MLVCGISREVPIHPVVTPSGQVYERDRILEHLQNSNTDPIDGQPLNPQQLIELQIAPINSYPSDLRSNKFSDLLGALQQQYNSAMEEIHDLRVRLAEAQRELATELYENEAAKRVIARLLQQQQQGQTPEPQPPQQQVDQLAADLKAKARDNLHKRKEQRDSNIQFTNQICAAYQNVTFSRVVLGISDVLTAMDQNFIFGTSSGALLSFDPQTGSIIRSVQIHDSPLIQIEADFNRQKLVSVSEIGQLCVLNNGFEVLARFDTNKQIIGASWHRNGRYLYVVSADGGVFIFNELLELLREAHEDLVYDSMSLHCDGALLVVSSGNTVRFWDIGLTRVYNIHDSNLPDRVHAMEFSPNGWYLAIASGEIVRVLSLTNGEFIDLPMIAYNISFDLTGGLMALSNNSSITLVNVDCRKQVQVSTVNNFQVQEIHAMTFESQTSWICSISHGGNEQSLTLIKPSA